MKQTYILRARVIEGSIPMPHVSCDAYAGLTHHNFEIIAPYTKENLRTLFAIGKDAWIHGDLSKFEILAWAGGANNHDGARYLWSIRPDLWNFDSPPHNILENFDSYEPQPLPEYMKAIYDRFWKPMKFGFTLTAYLEHIQTDPSLDEKILATSTKTQIKQSPTAHKTELCLE